MKVVATEFARKFINLTTKAYEKDWHERNGGNLSYRIRPGELDPIRKRLQEPELWVPIGVEVPNLGGEYFLVTGSGKFMQNIAESPEDNIAIALIDEQGENYCVVWGLESGGRPTSEFPTHLMNHAIKKRCTDGEHRVIYHAHPVDTIALTFVLPHEDKAFTRELWSMITECPVIFPEGVGIVPWMVPGGKAIALATGNLMEKYNVVIWAHHGVFCSGKDFDEVFGLMDTVEKAAEIAVKVRSMGGVKNCIQTEHLRELAREFHVSLNEDFLD